jgi:excisionase family DNA binding protein
VSAECERLLSADEVAEVLGVSTARIYELLRSGLLPCIKIGRQRRVSPAQLRAWLDGGGQSLPGPGGWRREAPSGAGR